MLWEREQHRTSAADNGMHGKQGCRASLLAGFLQRSPTSDALENREADSRENGGMQLIGH